MKMNKAGAKDVWIVDKLVCIQQTTWSQYSDNLCSEVLQKLLDSTMLVAQSEGETKMCTFLVIQMNDGLNSCPWRNHLTK